jgi:hypothetical protein
LALVVTDGLGGYEPIDASLLNAWADPRSFFHPYK